jgi:hypothetical protein
MPTLLLSMQHQKIFLILHIKSLKNNCSGENLLILVGIFYPSGEPISLHRRRCSPFAVVHYSIMGHYLAVAAISTRE